MRILKKYIPQIKKIHQFLFKNNNVVTLIINHLNGNIIHANTCACKFYGYEVNELTKMKISDITLLPESEIFNIMKKSFHSHFENFSFEQKISTGETRYVKVHAGPLNIFKQNYVYFTIEDFTYEKNLEKSLKKKIFQYKQLLNNANDAIFLSRFDNSLTFNSFLSINDTACNLLGYTRTELLSQSITSIILDYTIESNSKVWRKLLANKKATIKVILISKQGKYIPVELGIHTFEMENEIYVLSISRDISEYKSFEEKSIKYSTLLEGVLSGIPDIIGVYNPDNTVMFYNKAGYDFFDKTPEEVSGKKCYEILGRTHHCAICSCSEALNRKQLIRIEKYIPEFDKYMDCSCNPVFDDNGEIIVLIEQMRDITQKKKLEYTLKESTERYKKIVELSPDAIIITIDKKIVFANNEVSKLVGIDIDKILTKPIYNFVDLRYLDVLNKRINHILKDNVQKTSYDYKFISYDNKIIDIEVYSSYLIYEGKPAIQSVIRNITKKKMELNRAGQIQQSMLPHSFPLPEKAYMETLYKPAKTVSGDFYNFHRLNENYIIGILFDVSGKGISAALNVSAFNVLFHEAAENFIEPSKIINYLNKKISYYLGEHYVAACCFSFDFQNNIAKIIGAGINQFTYSLENSMCKDVFIKGPFLGMFENSIFDENIINFNSGDKFYFYSDGLDPILAKNSTYMNCKKLDDLISLAIYLEDYLNGVLPDTDVIKDDCTLITLEIK